MQQFQFSAPHPLELASSPGRRYACTLIAAGELQGHGLHVSADVLQRDAAKFTNLEAYVNHSWWPRLEQLAGLFAQVAYDPVQQAITGVLVLKSTPAADWLQRVIDEVIADQDNGAPALNIGLSADCWVSIGEATGDSSLRPVTAFHDVSSVDIVCRPASGGARFDRILAQAGPLNPAQPTLQEVPMTVPTQEPAKTDVLTDVSTDVSTTPQPAPEPTPVQAHAAPQRSGAEAPAPSPAPAPAPASPAGHWPAAGVQATPQTDLAAELAALRAQFADLAARQAITGFDTPRPQPHSPVVAADMTTPADHAQAIVNWMFGVDKSPLPEPAMRTPRHFYYALTGDHDWHGHVVPERAQFASASTLNLADLAANAMNKVLVQQWPALEVYRWFEEIVTVVPNDGSVRDMAWISFGGIGNLPQVGQGATYTELNVADSRENDSFAKYGGYVGVTVEMWRNNDMQQMQAIPRALAVAAVRTRSEKIAAIFTANSGTGPTLDDDSTVLFHSDHGSNVQTTAFSAAAWKAARLECFKHTELGSGKRLGLYPKYALIPADLWDDSLVQFGYGAGPGGYPGTANNDTNPYAIGRSNTDPRPIPIVVPDWSDANDWAYLVDKNLHPVIMMTYAQNPGGGSHPMPELFSVASPTAGLVFTNDVLPIKVRDWFSYGVATWRGVGKRNVT